MHPIDGDNTEALETFSVKDPVLGIDHHVSKSEFATCQGNAVNIWDPTQTSEAVHSFTWGTDSILSVKYNPAEDYLVASTGTDRTIGLYDTRMHQQLRKVVLSMRSNALAWNPMEPFNFTVANEDHNLYTFDMRKLASALMVHKDHVSAVMDVAYSPTGREFVSGSYDRTIRLFGTRHAKSREIYHTKRMQRVFSVAFTADAKFVLSGSDDTNIRMWKAQASKSLSTVRWFETLNRYLNIYLNIVEYLFNVQNIDIYVYIHSFSSNVLDESS